ncbi:MAG: histidine kinase dimerization/phospho-acceptor domain-containing protein, partial [Candidatus Binatia bacterium]
MEIVLRFVPDFSWVEVHSRHQDRKKVLINVHWLVVATSYFMLFNKGQVIQDPWIISLILVLLISSISLYPLPQWIFDHRLFALTLVVVDTILFAMSIGLTRESPGDLFIVFFFGLFIAATGDTLIKVIAGCFIIAIVPLIMNSLSGVTLSRWDSDLLLRLPFLFVVFILYGYLDDQARQEKIRAEKAEATERLKRQLVSALAHDIKNPLGIIMGYAESVTDRLEGKPEEGQTMEALQHIQGNAERIVKLVTGFLDASRAESGMMELVPKPVQLNVLLREVGQQQMGALRRKDISLKVVLDDHLPEIMGDAGQIDRVLWNLVGNAIKFTPNGGTITMTSRLENGTVCVGV